MNRLRKQALDQALHFTVAALIVGLASIGNPFLCGVAGFIAGMLREVTEAGLPVTWAKIKAAPLHSDAPLDLSFWTLGGLLAGLVGGS